MNKKEKRGVYLKWKAQHNVQRERPTKCIEYPDSKYGNYSL